MNNTTGLERTALSIAARVSVDNDFSCEGLRWKTLGVTKAAATGLASRVACRKTWTALADTPY